MRMGRKGTGLSYALFLSSRCVVLYCCCLGRTSDSAGGLARGTCTVSSASCCAPRHVVHHARARRTWTSRLVVASATHLPSRKSCFLCARCLTLSRAASGGPRRHQQSAHCTVAGYVACVPGCVTTRRASRCAAQHSARRGIMLRLCTAVATSSSFLSRCFVTVLRRVAQLCCATYILPLSLFACAHSANLRYFLYTHSVITRRPRAYRVRALLAAAHLRSASRARASAYQ